MKKVLAFLLGASLSFLLIFVAVGFFSTKEYEGVVSKKLYHSPEKVWTVLTDLESLPKRRREVVKVEMLGINESGLERWKEYTDMGGYILFEYLEKVPEQKLVVNMQESTFGMSGSWTYELEPNEKDCNITITEKTTIDNLFVRTLMTLSGRNANLKKEMHILEKALQPTGLVKAKF